MCIARFLKKNNSLKETDITDIDRNTNHGFLIFVLHITTKIQGASELIKKVIVTDKQKFSPW
jgi:hypothetical protein